MKKALFVAALSLSITTPALAMDEEHKSPHWGYTGDQGAAHWGELDESFETCKSGEKQSPINIDKYMQGDVQPLDISYVPSPLEVVNNGTTVQVHYAPGSTLNIDKKSYSLKEITFHTPSEHYMDGAPYPMEAHFVHITEDGTTVIISTMIKVGAHNPTIEGIWQNVPASGLTKTVESVSILAEDIMPSDRSYYSYEGSLTTPPCTEGVQWFVLKEPIEISTKQLTAFQGVFPVNARPIQTLGDRSIVGN